jgi:ribonuclease D
MGRYKRKQGKNSSVASALDASSSSSSGRIKRYHHKCNAFSPPELDRVKEFLTNYRDGCFRVGVQGENAPPACCFSKPQTIGGVNFPALTQKVLSQPYLILPSALTSKQRRIIHSLSAQLDLFHESFGVVGAPSSRERNIVISIYSDGFDFLPSVATEDSRPSSTVTIPVRQCRPWFCRHATNPSATCTRNGSGDDAMSGEESVKEANKRCRQHIEALMDQPGDCLRDDIDLLDFVDMDGQDLSTIETPSASDRDGDHWIMVDTADKMKACAEELLAAGISELAFDLEFYNPSKYLQVTCLLQISSNVGKDYVIDTLAAGVWDDVALLRPLFANASIVKIGHCIPGDVKSLHRDFGIFVINAFDTYEAAQVLQLKHQGLASVCGRYGLQNSEEYRQLKALYQSTDWRRRPLTEPMVRYGRYDVHYLVALRRLMIRDLVKDKLWTNLEAKQETQRVAQALAATLSTIAAAEGDVDEDEFFMNRDDDDLPESNLSDDDDDDDDGFYTPTDGENGEPRTTVGTKALRMQPDLMSVFSVSQQRCLDLWRFNHEPLSKNNQYADLMKLAQAGEVKWTKSHASLLEDLVAWRTQVATKEECLEGMTVETDLLISVATKRPTSEAALRRITYNLPELLNDSIYINELLAIVRTSFSKGATQTPVMIPSYEEVSIRKAKSRRSDLNLWIAAVAAAAVLGLGVIHLSRRRR